jgi:NADP-dependent 3-hydroxy acid dehydrogenase YdfG
MPMASTGPIAAVSGASGGTGRAIAVRLASYITGTAISMDGGVMTGVG